MKIRPVGDEFNVDGRKGRQTDRHDKTTHLKKTNILPVFNSGLKPTPKLALLQQCDRMLDQIHGV